MIRLLNRRSASTRPWLGAVAAAAFVVGSCGGGSSSDGDGSSSGSVVAAAETAQDEAGVRVVSPAAAQALIDAGGRTLLDVRTPAEFDEAHLVGAVLIDFQAANFAEELAKLDPNAQYVLYCRSGNRSGQARAMMVDLGFVDVADVEGGIVNWVAAGLPVETS